MKSILLLYFTLLTYACYAQPARQDTTLAFSRPGYDKDPIRARLKKVVTRKDDLWEVALIDEKGVLFEKISYGDAQLTVRKGAYQRYERGKIVEEGDYDKGYKVGIWKKYIQGKLVATDQYRWDQPHGEYSHLWDSGNVKEKGEYNNGRRLKRKLFYENGKLAANELYNDINQVDGMYFDQEGRIIEKAAIISPPSFPGGQVGFNDYLKRKLKYPSTAKKENIQGTVKVQFTVRADGSVANPRIVESTRAALDQEAARVVANSRWIPGRELGNVVAMEAMVLVKFSLEN